MPRRLVAAVLVLLVLASAGTLAWLLSQRSGESSDLQAQREKVMSQARQFVLRVNTYGPDLLEADGTMPQYREQVGEVITDKFAESFEQSVPAAEATVAQARVRPGRRGLRRGRLGHRQRLGHRAGGRLVHQLLPQTRTTPRTASDDIPLPFRVQVKLVKVDGELAGRRVHARDRRDARGPDRRPVGRPLDRCRGEPAAEQPSPSEEASP